MLHMNIETVLALLPEAYTPFDPIVDGALNKLVNKQN